MNNKIDLSQLSGNLYISGSEAKQSESCSVVSDSLQL